VGISRLGRACGVRGVQADGQTVLFNGRGGRRFLRSVDFIERSSEGAASGAPTGKSMRQRQRATSARGADDLLLLVEWRCLGVFAAIDFARVLLDDL